MKLPTFNPVLTQTAAEYSQKQDGFIANRLFPFFPTQAQAAEYPVFKKENLLNVPAIKARAPGAAYERISMEFGQDTYATQDYGIEMPLDDRQLKIYPNLIAAQQAKTITLTRAMMVNKEIRARQIITTSGLPTSTPTTKWDQASADIIGDVKTITRAIYENCGMMPNMITMPLAVWNFVSESPQIVERIKYTFGGSVTKEMVARLFEVDEIVIAMSNNNTANEGATQSISSIWQNDVIFAVSDVNFDLETPSLGRTFGWIGNTPSGGEYGMKTYRDDKHSSWIHQIMHDVTEKVQASACGYIFTSVLT